jgi:phenylpyruvate tautomerase PptA (4-oxalocrotonate tautomerase family)
MLKENVMPIAYLDVPTGADLLAKRELVKALYEALHEVWPFPDDTRIFLREWPLDSVSQNGLLGSEPARPVLIMHVPQDGNVDAKRKMLKKVNAAVAEAYHVPDFVTFMHEHPLDRVAVDGALLADDQQRVEDQAKVYS